MSLLKKRHSVRDGIPHLVRLPSKSSTNFYDGMNGDNSCPSSPAIKKSYRLVVVGSQASGKSALVQRFLDAGFDERYLPTIENFHRKLYKVRGELVQLDIMDRSGLDPFPASRKLAYSSGDLFLIVSSVDNAASVEQMAEIREHILECKQARGSFSATSSGGMTSYNSSPASCSSATSSSFVFSTSSSSREHDPPMLFVLNKTDLPRYKWEVSVEEVRDMVRRITTKQPHGGGAGGGGKERPLPLEACSAALNEHVTKAFGRLFAMGKLPKLMYPELHKQLRTELSADGMLVSGRGDKTEAGAGGGGTGSARSRILQKMKTRFSRESSQRSSEDEGSSLAAAATAAMTVLDAPGRRISLRTDLLLKNSMAVGTLRECGRVNSLSVQAMSKLSSHIPPTEEECNTQPLNGIVNGTQNYHDYQHPHYPPPPQIDPASDSEHITTASAAAIEKMKQCRIS